MCFTSEFKFQSHNAYCIYCYIYNQKKHFQCFACSMVLTVQKRVEQVRGTGKTESDYKEEK